MKKTMIALALGAMFASGVVHAYTATVTTSNNNFTMVGAANGLTGGNNDTVFTWDGTYRSAVSQEQGGYNATLSSVTAFSGKKWTAHHMNVYGPGTYTFYTGCASGGAASTSYNPSCGLGAVQTLTVGAGQVGAHMLFDWSVNTDIDVIVLWDMNKSWAQTGTTSPMQVTGTSNTTNNSVNTVWNGVSIDADGDTWSGAKMVDGPFVGQSANFSVNGVAADATPPTVSAVSPANAAPSAPYGATNYAVTFSEAVRLVDNTALTFSPAVTVGTPTTTDNITWNFPVTLTGSTAYTVQFNAGPKDLYGNALTLPANKTFTTAATLDTTSPTLVSKSPTASATNVAVSSPIVVTFSEAMGPTTAGAISLSAGGTSVACTFVPNATNTIYTCTPATPLANNTTYTVSVGANASRTPSDPAAAQDASGNNLITAGANTWTFTTVAVTTMTSGSATITTGSGSLVSFSVQTPGQIGGTPPASTTLDSGLSYTLNGVSNSVAVTMTFPASIVGKTLYKVNGAGVYTAIPEGDFSRNPDGMTITMTIADNGPYDQDATTGVITDPIVPGVAVAQPTLGSSTGGGGGCAFGSNSKFDPAMLMMLLGSLGYLGWKRKQRN